MKTGDYIVYIGTRFAELNDVDGVILGFSDKGEAIIEWRVWGDQEVSKCMSRMPYPLEDLQPMTLSKPMRDMAKRQSKQ